MTQPRSRLSDTRLDEHECRRLQCVIELVGQRWTGAILIAAAHGARRFIEYRTMVAGISDRLLTVRLKELEDKNLVLRTVIPSTPVQIRYSLTPLGHELVAALEPLGDFAERHLGDQGERAVE